MTTFYQEQASNRRNSVLLVLLVVAFLGVFGYIIGYVVSYGADPYGDSSVTWGIGATMIAVAFGLLSAVGSYYGGDQLVLASSHAKEISSVEAPMLFNIVNEMAVAAGVPMPKVYIIPEESPNAFATGRDPEHSSIAVTTGLLQKMDREELQGIIGHEMSHIRNYDIRFTLIVGVLVGSIALLAQIFLRYTFWFGGGRGRDSDSKGSGSLGLILLIVGVVLAILAPIFSAFVQMAVSRQREYLADASSVELTRNPHGLQRALAKLASDRDPFEAANGATQHLFIVNPLKKLGGGSALFSTHPPIVDRINRLRQLTGDAPLDPVSVRQLGGLE